MTPVVIVLFLFCQYSITLIMITVP